MSWGAWILVLVYPVGLLLWWQPTWARAHRRGLLLTAVAMGVGLGLYTGLLLGTMPARPLWNSALLGPLFLTSGISSGAALLLLFASDEDERRALVRWDVLAIGGELVLIALLFVGWASGGAVPESAAAAFLGGPYTAVFWSLVVVMGLLVPLAMDLVESRRHLAFTAAAPVLVLAGGLALRWVLLVAGQRGMN
jgi:formate-dependent nitrite reductase membrane component NrfD